MKDLLKKLRGIMLDAIEGYEPDGADMKFKKAAVVFDRYDDKIRELTQKLTDTQCARLQSIYESAAKGIKEVIEEVEKGVSSEKSPDKKPKFKVGQRVQFKTWDELEKEFGVYAGGGIKTPKWGFTKGMEYLCGTYATIKSIDGREVQLVEFSCDRNTDWFFTTDMIKAVE